MYIYTYIYIYIYIYVNSVYNHIYICLPGSASGIPAKLGRVFASFDPGFSSGELFGPGLLK